MAKVSIILPAFKRQFLHEAIASILAQTYRDFELVVVDDCSPEDLRAVVDEFHDERIKYHRNPENLGHRDLIAAWEKAIGYARGEWCILASDDDVYLPRCLESLMALTAKYPACDLFHARNAEIDGNGRVTAVANARAEFESQILFSRVRVRGRDQRAPDFMFRLESLRQIGGFVRFPLAWHSDDATWMMLAARGCAHTAAVQFHFRRSGLNLTEFRDRTALAKVEAGELFRAWYGKFVAGLPEPMTAEEREVREELLASGNEQISYLEEQVVTRVTNERIWRSALKRLPIPHSEKRRLYYDRHPRLRAFRRLLPWP